MKRGIRGLIFGCLCVLALSCSTTPDRRKLTQHIEFEILNPDSLAGNLWAQNQLSTIAKIEKRLDTYNVEHIVERDSSAGENAYTLRVAPEVKLAKLEQMLLKKGEFGLWAMHLAHEIINTEIKDSLVQYIDFQLQAGGAVIAYVLPEKKEHIMATIATLEKRNLFPAGTKFAFGRPEKLGQKEFCALYALKGVGGVKKERMSGKHIVSANAKQSERNGAWVVSADMDATGANQFKEATSENIGRPLAMVFDDEVFSAPFVNNTIESGSFLISGDFTKDEAKQMATMLQLGALPLPVDLKVAKANNK